jgi:hypothetical protein
VTPLILKRAPIGWNQHDYDVLEDGMILGRIFKVPIAPQDQPWMWASGHALSSTGAASQGDLARGSILAAQEKGDQFAQVGRCKDFGKAQKCRAIWGPA